MKCPHCNTVNRDEAKFCDYCGMELPTVAPDAHEIFDDAQTARLDDTETRLAGIDRINDSSYSNHMADITIPLSKGSADVTVPLGNGSADVTAPLGQGAGDQAKSFIASASPAEGGGGQGRTSRVRTVIIVILCVLVLGLVVAGVTYSAELWGGKVIPDLIGADSSEAVAKLSDAGFQVERELVKSDEVEGIVLACSPEPGSRAAEGSLVTIQVSTSRLVPNIVGKTREEAEALFASEGLTNIEYVEVKSNEPESTILKVSPVSGTRTKAEASISVEVAVPFRVPDVSGMTKEQAIAELEAEGYTAEITTVYAEDVEEGCVVVTDPVAGSALASGEVVGVSIAMHRSSELIALTTEYLNNLSTVSIDGQSYEVEEVISVSYDSENTCVYSISARPYETHSWFGIETETRYGNVERITGTITWTSSNTIESTDPQLRQI